jgi:hypothetical protein
MENSLKSSISSGRVNLDPEVCKGALYAHLQKQHDKPTYGKAMSKQLDRLEKEVTHRGELHTPPPPPPTRPKPKKL